MLDKAPKIHTDRILIAHKEKTALAAIASSYFGDAGNYLPFFLFPNVGNYLSTKNDDFQDDGYIARMIGEKEAVLINNAMARMDRCGTIILVGLDKHQKSYLRIPSRIPIIEVDDISQVESQLLPISDKKGTLECSTTDILKGLYQARKLGKHLVINEKATMEETVLEDGKGIIVLEKSENAMAVVGVNYAHAVSANLLIVEDFNKDDVHGIERNIQKWRENKSYNQLQKCLNKINHRIGSISFGRFKYATFFTVGLPYSLSIKNIIPCSYVPLSLRPDLFIVNSILFERARHFNSAVVFSPGFFQDEETKNVFDLFVKSHYYVRALIGRNATVRNLDFHAQHFPYDILHICTHGGEVDGYSVTETYRDRKGDEHTVEYDEVVGFAPIPGKDLIELHRKLIFRKFDGFIWMSPELRKQSYQNYVYEDMRKRLLQKESENKSVSRTKKQKIPTSCAIACSDSIHQGMFQLLASHSSPFVFNNACWSWSEVARFFLTEGARGYIGTLWDIDNDAAVAGANAFYDNLFDKGVMRAFFEAIKAVQGTDSADINIYWGLHFSTLPRGGSYDESRGRVFKELVRSFLSWAEKAKSTKEPSIRKNTIEIAHRIQEEILANFELEDVEKLDVDIKQQITDKSRQSRSSGALKEVPAIQDIQTLDVRMQIRKMQ